MLDPAIALSLLGVSREQLETYKVPKHVGKFNQTLIGQLLESLVYQSLIIYADANDAQLYHFRDAKDQYIEHLNWFEDTVKDEFQVTKVLLNTGPYAYTR